MNGKKTASIRIFGIFLFVISMRKPYYQFKTRFKRRKISRHPGIDIPGFIWGRVRIGSISPNPLVPYDLQNYHCHPAKMTKRAVSVSFINWIWL
ncbi:MAG: hypothetical protein KKC20_14160 [Proteobacteria bacterium]|nr:hypothetical protein [Pseudomonadota bacterium]